MVDEVRLLRLLRAVSDEVGVLRAEASANADRRVDRMWLRGVKYSFIAAIEGCIDAGQHVCASEGWGPPQNNGHVMRVLAEHGVLETELGARMARAAGFRNVLVLVHDYDSDYVEVDDEVVLARLADLSDLDAFVVAVAALAG